MAFASEAALNSALKYAPQRQALAELQQAAREQFHSSVKAGEGEGVLAGQQAQRAVPQIEQIFAGAQRGNSRAQELLKPTLEGLSANSPWRKAAEIGQTGNQERLGTQEAAHLSDAVQARTAASEIPGYARNVATSKLIQELTKLASKEQALGGQEGMSTASLEAAARKEAAKEARAEAKEAAKDAFSEKLHGLPTYKDLHPSTTGSEKPLTTAEQNKGISEAKTIYNLARGLAGRHLTREQAVAELSREHPGVNIKLEGGKSTKTAGGKAYAPNTLMSAALDAAYLKEISIHTGNVLKEEGYNPQKFAAVFGVPLAKKGPVGKSLKSGGTPSGF